MILESYKFLVLYLILILPSNQVNGIIHGKIQFYRSKYFDERSIHADIGRDMNVVCNHVKAFNAGIPNNRENNDVIKYANDKNMADNKPIKEESMGTKCIGAKTNELVADNIVDKQGNKDFIDLTNTFTNKLRSDTPVRKDNFVSGDTNVHKREVLMMGGKQNMESDGNVESAHQHTHTVSPPSDLTKRLISVQNKQYVRQNTDTMKSDLPNLSNMRQENQFSNKYPVQNPNTLSQMMSAESGQGQPECTPLQLNYQSMEGPAMAPQGLSSEIKEPEVQLKEHPVVARLFEKQRQIENLKQLLMQVESKFQMEVNEVGRLQQSVAEAEKELDEAVRLMQEVKIKNIKGMQHIEAAQDAAGRNLESKALKAHAEESQLALHDQVLFSERQRLNALRAQMIYLQTELASAQNSGILSFDDNKSNFQPYAFHYKSPSLSESLKYFQSSPNKQSKSIGPYVNTDSSGNPTNNVTGRKNPYLLFS
ncbi:hypothetical protein WDU94_011787 [Cyamophila willieti]